MDGVFLSPSEDEFVGRIVEELEHFMEQGQHHRVLLFPPLSSRLRYLIHRTVENMELLSSFSVGEGWRRRTVICHSAVRLPSEPCSDPKPGPPAGRAQRPAQPWGRGARGARGPRHAGDTHGDSARATVGSGRISRPPRRKPERAPFVPRGGRRKANWRERESPGDEAAAGGENGARNAGREQQELGRAGGSPGKDESVPGTGSAEHPLRGEKVPSLGNGGDCCEREGRGEDCSHSPSSAHHKHRPEAEEEPSHGSAITAEHSKHPPEAEEEPSHGSTAIAEHNKHSPEAGEEEPSHGSSAIAEGREFQAQLEKEKQSSRDSRGSECGRSCVPLENHGGSRTAPGVTAPGVTAPGVAAPGVTDTVADQQSCNSQGIQAVPSPSAGQVEQEHLQKVLEGPAEALAAPEPLHEGDPGRIQGKEEEEDKEGSSVAEAMRRGLDLAAGDREGTRQSGPEDDCTAELLAEVIWGKIWEKRGKRCSWEGIPCPGGVGGDGSAEVRIGL
uniref:R3H domain-containing protein n=1 Tax=Junco hyemalis TaxID=40217 RepID=A0A8C5NKX4_JUNHY